MSSTNNGAEQFVCPFFHARLDKLTLMCDGPERDSRVRLHFPSVSGLCRYKAKYCCSFNYVNCYIARGAESGWEKE